jgi:hypothetical protein
LQGEAGGTNADGMAMQTMLSTKLHEFPFQINGRKRFFVLNGLQQIR